MKSSNVLSPDYMCSMLKRMDSKPVETFGVFSKAFSGFESSVGSKRGIFIALVVAFYYLIMKSRVVREAFLNDAFFDGKSMEFLEDRLLLSVFRFALKAPTSGPLYDRARVYANAMAEAVAEKIDPLDIPELIKKAGGIDRLSKDVRERKNQLENEVPPPVRGTSHAQAQTTHNNPNDRIVGGEQEGGNTDRGDKDKHNGKGESKTSRPTGRAPKPKDEKIPFDPRSDLVINYPVANELWDLLASNATEGEVGFRIVREEGKPPRFVKTFCTYK